jgi:hypothetical protein
VKGYVITRARRGTRDEAAIPDLPGRRSRLHRRRRSFNFIVEAGSDLIAMGKTTNWQSLRKEERTQIG